jgi:hypothetical protein
VGGLFTNNSKLIFNIQFSASVIKFILKTIKKIKHMSYIPRPDAAFNTWQGNLMADVASKAPAWNISLDAVAALQALQARWKTAYAAYENPATRNPVIVQEKQDARDAYEAELRKFVKSYLAYNPAVTDNDRKKLGLTVPKTSRTPAPVATTYPDFDIDSSVIRCLTIHFYDQGSKKSKAKPTGQHGSEIRWAISDTLLVDVKDLIHSSFDTHTPFTLEFEGHERGKTVYFCLCWENTRGEKGPWSEIQSAVIP